MKETTLVFCAHSDDEVIGMGGTIAKYSHEGKDIIVVIFSKGDASSPWLKKHYLIEERKKEAQSIDAYIGVKRTINLGLKDGHLAEEIEKKKIRKTIKSIIKHYHPSQIFTHSKFDPHFSGDHKAVNKAVVDVLENLDPKRKISTFVFEVWNIRGETSPKMYVDVSSTFKKKIKAMLMFRSQWSSIYPLLSPVYIRAKLAGIQNHTKFAERFYKVR